MTPSPEGHDLTMVISDLSAGGAQRVFSLLVGGLTAEGWRVCVVTLSEPQSDFFTLPSSVTRFSIGGLAPSSGPIAAAVANIARLRSLRAALRSAGSRRVLSFLTAMNVLTLIASVGMGNRVVVSERNDPARQPIGRMWRVLRRVSYPFAAIVTANSRTAIDRMRPYVANHRLRFVRNPLPIVEVLGDRRADPGFVLAIGRLVRQKGFDVLLRAWAILPAELHSWKLAVVGEGELAGELEALAARLGIEGRVRWVGRVANPREYYRGAALFVLPSRYEGTPNVLLEAMAHGLPVIVTSTCEGALEFVKNDVTGLVVASEDVFALAQTMERCLRASDLRLKLGAAAAERLQQEPDRTGLDTSLEVLSLN